MTSTPQPATTIWWPDTTNVLDAALAAHNAGLCVIPLKGKRPALGGWKQYQQQRPTEQDIRRWAQEGLLQNLGVVCGQVSGNLAVLDFDGPGAYGAFAALFPTWRHPSPSRRAAGRANTSICMWMRCPPPPARLTHPSATSSCAQRAPTWRLHPAFTR